MTEHTIGDYSFKEHIHRFALWTAARAASRSLLKNSEVEQLLILTGFQHSLHSLKQQDITGELFDNWHKAQCEQLKEAFDKFQHHLHWNNKRMSYGIAAKIINIYIKTSEVLSTRGTSALSFHAHPPIDSILLRKINKVFPNYKLTVNWSSFKEEEYIGIINIIRKIVGDQPLWTIEYFWKIPISNITEI